MSRPVWNEQESARVGEALKKASREELTASEIEALIDREMEKDEAQMDTEWIDACCRLLCQMHGRDELCAPVRETLPPALSARLRPPRSFLRHALRFAARTAVAAVFLTAALMGMDMRVDRPRVSLTQSDDEQQAIVSLQPGGDVITHADANGEDSFERVYLAPSLPALWQHAGYALPLPERLPAGMRAVKAYMLPVGSVDLITVAYEGERDEALQVHYWYDASREAVLLGYESWPSQVETVLPSGDTVLRFPDMEQREGTRRAVWIAPHMTCVMEGEQLAEADFAAVLASVGRMQRSEPPAPSPSDPSDPLASQPPVSSFSPPQLHFYDWEAMRACVRYDVPLPESMPEGMHMEQGVYIHMDGWDMVDIRLEASEGRGMSILYERYGESREERQLQVEQNAQGRRVLLPNGSEAYIAYNCDVVFGMITGERGLYMIHLEGYDEQTLLDTLHSLPSLTSFLESTVPGMYSGG